MNHLCSVNDSVAARSALEKADNDHDQILDPFPASLTPVACRARDASCKVAERVTVRGLARKLGDASLEMVPHLCRLHHE